VTKSERSDYDNKTRNRRKNKIKRQAKPHIYYIALNSAMAMYGVWHSAAYRQQQQLYTIAISVSLIQNRERLQENSG
jgi:uncharacterized membrane protein YiaA